MMMRTAILTIAATLNTCGAVSGAVGVDVAGTVKTTIKDLRTAEAQCSGFYVHPAACDAAEALVTADFTTLQPLASNWQPLTTQFAAKDALTAATGSNVTPATSVSATRVARLLLERTQVVLSTPASSLAPRASPNTALPDGYAKRLQLVLPGLANEVSAAADSCSTLALESCEVDALQALAGVYRLGEEYAGLVVSPADAPIDAILNPMLSDLSTSLSDACAAVIAGNRVDGGDPALWAADATEFNSAAAQLAR